MWKYHYDLLRLQNRVESFIEPVTARWACTGIGGFLPSLCVSIHVALCQHLSWLGFSAQWVTKTFLPQRAKILQVLPEWIARTFA